MMTHEIVAALRDRFKAPEYALMLEVGNATGHSTSSHADAIVMSLWPSRGLEIMGFEIKASRSDWLRELKNPAKAEPIASRCDRWYVVAPPDVIKPGELPGGWGYYAAAGGKLKLEKEAPKQEARPLDRGFIAAMLRRASEADEGVVRAMVQRETEKIREEERRTAAMTYRHAAERHQQLQKQVAAFEQASGVTIETYGDAAKIGAAVRLVREIGIDGVYSLGERMHEQAVNLAKMVEAVSAELKGEGAS